MSVEQFSLPNDADVFEFCRNSSAASHREGLHGVDAQERSTKSKLITCGRGKFGVLPVPDDFFFRYTARGVYDGFEDANEFADRLDDCEDCDSSKDHNWAGATCCGELWEILGLPW